MEIEERIKRIECVIWPPNGPNGPNGGEPTALNKSAEEISNIKQEFALIQKEVDKLAEIIIETKKDIYSEIIIQEIDSLKKSIQVIESRLSNLEKGNNRGIQAVTFY